MAKKAIAIMTSGGDSPGMNAAARAVVRTALYAGVDVYGINNGYKGMIEDDIIQLNGKSVSDIIQRGGTFLGTARSKEFMTPEGRAKAYANLEKRGINGLCVIGGDGSLRGAASLAKEHGISIVGLPGTIDNDVWGSDYTIGCDTAANTIIDAINKLRDTASAHRRCAVLEVMGRRCGWLAMVTGIAGGAEYILVPEVNYDLEEIIAEIKDLYENNKKRYIMVVVAEGAGKAVDIAEKIQQETGIETRPTVLGHVQRGGSPTIQDRIKASQLGEQAALALIGGISNVVYGFNAGRVVQIDLFDAVNNKKTLDPDYVRLARVLQ
ncbi:MAG: 6-phosphofructokinase [Selenomonadaceae bacterium]|nr:6-phosphofructokinase [Selenomonadaceae bacterium]